MADEPSWQHDVYRGLRSSWEYSVPTTCSYDRYDHTRADYLRDVLERGQRYPEEFDRLPEILVPETGEDAEQVRIARRQGRRGAPRRVNEWSQPDSWLSPAVWGRL
jgi:hypothetical protein